MNPKIVHNKWIKNHPNWKGVPHIRYWYYADSEDSFNKFLNAHPDIDYAPNDSWKSMYDIIVLD